jgi:hypothetical protein
VLAADVVRRNRQAATWLAEIESATLPALRVPASEVDALAAVIVAWLDDGTGATPTRS